MRSCDAALGMQSGDIPDSALSASSSYVPNVGPRNGRLRTERTGGAWCPRLPVESGVREFLQVDLGQVHVVTGVETQGRYDHGRGQEYAEEYTLEYWRPGLHEWKEYSRWDGKKILSGNTDTSTVVSHRLMPALFASRLRVLPYSVHRRTVCLRVELRGCLFDGGVVSYQIPEEPSADPAQDLTDPPYDGERRDGLLWGGLGMLVDGQVGGDNFRLDIGYGKGNGWVAWKRASFPDNYVEMIFEFDDVRNFSAVHVFTNNFFSRGVQVFSRAKILFSNGGQFYNGKPLSFSYMPDPALEHARNVSVRLHQRAGRFLKLRLYFAAEWIMVSEVLFESAAVDGNFTDEAASSHEDVLTDPEGARTRWDSFETMTAPRGDQGYVEAVVGVLTAVSLLLLLVFVVILVVSRRQKLHGSPTFLRTMNMKDLLMTLSPLNSSGVVPVSGQPTPTSQDPCSKTPSLVFHSAPPGRDEASLASLCSGAGSQVFAVEEAEAAEAVAGGGTAPEAWQPRGLRASETCAQLRSLGRDRSQLQLQAARCATEPSRKRRFHTSPREKQAAPPLVTRWNLVPSEQHAHKCREADLAMVPRQCLHVTEKIGSCHLGEVVLCDARRLEGVVAECGRTVAARIHRDPSADDGALLREARFLAGLRDPNVARVLGLCADERPPWTVTEYCDMGDLAHFLQYTVHRETTILPPSSSVQALSIGCLTYMTVQIASAMKYLESKHVVHKDLAARNCLVGRGYKVKVADIAMCSSLYHKDYTELGERQMVPIRWLPWESIVLDRYSCAGNSWSFAVTAWEVMNLAREKPFQQLSNQEVILSADRMYYGEELQVLLPKPVACSADMYELLCECWSRDEDLRPTLRDIYTILKRKIVGYRPGD
ncbi:discoidin domain-containing receptor 2-like [Bacillus rossius redtenbacheri]|uniref:discoidin domain-containing receptor 2-like n=1 Tax=Bacillus rossius redtenbacheri TaxID=93214 RepID=UPI002FDF02FC